MYSDNILLRGVFPALVSPMDEDGKILEKPLRALVSHLMKSGINGFYLCGGTGEGTVMTLESRKALLEIVNDEVKGRVKLAVHVGAIEPREAVALAEHAAYNGADAISSVPPFFYNYGQKGIYQYYDALSKASGLPLFMYVSPLAGVAMPASTVDGLMEIDTMFGLKWTNYNYYEMSRIKDLRGGNINVINGPDECLALGLMMGADGGIGSTYNLFPKIYVGIYEAFRRGDIEAMRALQKKANAVINLLIDKYEVIPGIKAILTLLGFEVGYATYPMKRLTSEELAQLRLDLKALSFEEEYL